MIAMILGWLTVISLSLGIITTLAVGIRVVGRGLYSLVNATKDNTTAIIKLSKDMMMVKRLLGIEDND